MRDGGGRGGNFGGGGGGRGGNFGGGGGGRGGHFGGRMLWDTWSPDAKGIYKGSSDGFALFLSFMMFFGKSCFVLCDHHILNFRILVKILCH
ncbi:hypothetical protein HanRHA438_Chr15g0730821 [Helianthus annuus]|nr:hypothetical protein HanRHA438_Chr15g0730821 [Helianthus annuus]